MVFIIVVVFILLNYSIPVRSTSFYANITDRACLSIDVKRNSSLAVYTVKLNFNTPVFIVLVVGSDFTVQGSTAENVEMIEFANQSLSFCRTSVKKEFAGIYHIEGENDTGSTLFILDKPENPKIFILENGTVGFKNASLRCSSKSTSLPYALNLTYIWMVNSVDIKDLKENKKYSFSENMQSDLYINTERNESLNSYTCRVVEMFGQSSELSTRISVEPYRKPALAIVPRGNEYNVIKTHNFSLTCLEIDSNPVALNYTWYKNNRIYATNVTEIQLLNAGISDSGNYKCKAQNKVGENESEEVKVNILYGPYIQEIPTKSEEEGYSIVVECNISSKPPVNVNDIYWTRSNDASFNVTGKSLQIRNLSKTDQRMYTCHASVVFTLPDGTQKSNGSLTSFELKVLYGPTVSLRHSYDQIEGKNVNILCNISSNPAVNPQDVKWTVNNTLHSTGFNLNISSLNKKDNGIYNCSTEISLNVSGDSPRKRFASGAVAINVLYGPEISLIDKVKQIEHYQIGIPCKVMSNPAPNMSDFIWSKNHVNVHQGPILTFKSVSKQNAGLYKCTVNLTLTPSDGGSEHVTSTDDVFLDVLYGPTVYNYTAPAKEEGQSLQIYCNISSNPVAKNKEVVWKKVGNATFNHTGKEMHIPSVDRSDLGHFICTVNITLLPTNGLPEEKTQVGGVEVIVYFQPFILEVRTENVHEGSRAQIKCSANGNPPPIIKWTYVDNDTDLTESEISFKNLRSTSYIVLPIARCEDTGTYKCQANNSINAAANKSVFLSVKCPPRLSYRGNFNITTGRNNSLNFTVFFHAVPKPTLTWSFNESILTDFIVTSVYSPWPYRHGTKLFKSDFGESNVGQYSINASNELGSISETFNIFYKGVPSKPYIRDLNCKEVHGTAKIEWESDGNGGLQQHFIVLYKPTYQSFYEKSDKTEEGSLNVNYVKLIYNLDGNTDYSFKVKAENKIGYVESREMNCTTLELMDQSILPIVGGVSGSIAAVAFVGAVFLIYKRRWSSKPQRDKDLIKRSTSDNQDDGEELKDNPLYVQSGQLDGCHVTNKTELENKQSNVYQDGLYENREDIVKNLEGPMYWNVNKSETPLKNDTRVVTTNKDGLVYADLEFSPSSNKFVIHGLENKNTYADIDLTRKAETLPLDSSDEENNLTK